MGDLATIDKVKDYIGAGTDTKDDTAVQRALDAAEDIIESYCGRTFAQAAYAEFYDGTGTDKLLLNHYPIISTPTVLEFGTALSVGEDPSLYPDVLMLKETGTLVMVNGVWIAERRYYKVNYDAGFATVPQGIVQAALDLAALILKEPIHVGIASKTTGQQTVSVIRKLPDYCQMALDLYRDHHTVRSL